MVGGFLSVNTIADKCVLGHGLCSLPWFTWSHTRVVRRRAGPKACASPDIPESLAFANTLAVTVKVQIHRNLGLNGQNKKNRHGKFRALHGGDGDDGDDMAKKLTMESQKFSSLTEQQNQIHHSTNPKYQNSPTRNVDKPQTLNPKP